MPLKPFSIYEKEICGHHYTIMAFKAREGLHLLARIAYYGANVLKIIPSDIKNISVEKLLDVILTEEMLQNIIEGLQSLLIEDDKLIELLVSIVKNCVRDGEELRDQNIFDLVFAENYEELFVLIKEVIVLNFLSQSFMKGFLKKEIAKQTQNPLPKNGQKNYTKN